MAASYADGTISVYGSYHGDRVFKLKDPEINFPFTAIAWKPTSIMSSDAQSFKATGSDGRIVQWRPKYQNEMKTLIVSEINSYQCLDYSPDGGAKFVVAGKQPYLEVFDDEKNAPLVELKAVGAIGHTNRIFCAKFDPV